MTHRHMKHFNPEVMLLEEPLQDFLNTKIEEFIDSDFTAMYLTLREVHMNHDD